MVMNVLAKRHGQNARSMSPVAVLTANAFARSPPLPKAYESNRRRAAATASRQPDIPSYCISVSHH